MSFEKKMGLAVSVMDTVWRLSTGHQDDLLTAGRHGSRYVLVCKGRQMISTGAPSILETKYLSVTSNIPLGNLCERVEHP